MNNEEKIYLIDDKINQINIHIGILQSNISNGYSEKEGQKGFQQMVEDFQAQKLVLEEEKLSLTNQG